MKCAILACELKKTLLPADEFSPEISDLKKRLSDTLEALFLQGVDTYLTSATRGIELWAAEAVLDLQETYPDIKLEIVVPYDKHSAKWDAATRSRYRDVLACADRVDYTSHDYTPGAISKRNRYLMENCSYFIGVFTEGTATEKTIRSARWNGKVVARLPLQRVS